MTLRVIIQRNVDGKRVEKIFPNWNYSTYWWEEGNAACDCNRAIMFDEASVSSIRDDYPCGHGKFAIRCVNNDTHEILYDELGGE